MNDAQALSTERTHAPAPTVEEAPPPAAPTPLAGPDLLEVEAEHRQRHLRITAARVSGAIPLGIGGAAQYVDRLAERDAALDAQKVAAAGSDPLQQQLDLAQLAYHVAVGKVAKVQASAESLDAQRQKLKEVVAAAEQDIIAATADEKEAAIRFAVTGTQALQAARVRQERATLRRDEAMTELQALDAALASVASEIERARAAMFGASSALWEIVARVKFRDAAPGLKALAESWAARVKSGSATTTLPEFLMMAFRQHMPNPESGAGIERRLKAQFFDE